MDFYDIILVSVRSFLAHKVKDKHPSILNFHLKPIFESIFILKIEQTFLMFLQVGF